MLLKLISPVVAPNFAEKQIVKPGVQELLETPKSLEDLGQICSGKEQPEGKIARLKRDKEELRLKDVCANLSDCDH